MIDAKPLTNELHALYKGLSGLFEKLTIRGHVLSPLGRNSEFVEYSLDWACLNTIRAVNAVIWVDIILFSFFIRMNTIYRTDLEAGSVFYTHTGLCDNECHGHILPESTYSLGDIVNSTTYFVK